MADQANFKHIKVNKGDDDVVIVAGEPSVRSESAYDTSLISTTEPKPAVVEPKPVAPEPRPAATEPKPVRQENSKENEYKPTSLADIEQSKMPLTQKIIIVLAVVAVVGFIIWYWLF